MLIPNTLIHDRYLVERQLGGADSTVYQALDLTTRAQVALKPLGALPPGASAEQAAGALPALRHPQLPAVLATFAEGGQAYLVLELAPGESLETLVQQDGPPPIEQGRRWARQLLDALDYLHTLYPPLVHGAIEPAGIRFGAHGEPVLLGLRPPGAPAAPAAPTPYAAPERLAGAAPDMRSDLYALAATLYYLLTGQPPTPAAERQRALAEGRPDPLPAPRALNIRVSAALSNALRQALALDPAQRPDGAAAVLTAIDDFPLPAPAPAAPRQPRVPPIAIIGAVLALLVAAFLLLRPAGSAPPAPTAAPVIGGSPTVVPTTAAPTVGAATAQPGQPTSAQTRTATSSQPPAAAPTDAPRFSVASVQPLALFTRTRPLTLTVQGANLGLVTSARLVTEDNLELTVAIISSGPDALVLDILPSVRLPNGEAAYRLELNGALVEAPPIVLRDFHERGIVQGVLAQYTYTGRVATDAAGAFTRMHAAADAGSAPVALLRNGDGLDVLDLSVAGWYQARIRTSADPSLVGETGWIERWLVDNQDVPDAPAPLVFVGRLGNTPTDGAVQCGAAFDSSIYGSVENARGAGIAGARLRVTSADGRNSYTVTTGRGGVYTVPGLGCTTWSVRLLSVPNAPNGIQANSITVRNLNGGKFTAAEVRFRQQR